MLLSLALARELVETDLSDTALQLLLDSTEQEIDRFAGSLASVTEVAREPYSASFFLTRPVSSVTSVAERALSTDATATTLDPSDYRLRGLRELVRTLNGPNGRSQWGDEVVVVYVPVQNLELRQQVQATLVKLSLEQDAFEDETAGDFKRTTKDDLLLERHRAMQPLRGGIGSLA